MRKPLKETHLSLSEAAPIMGITTARIRKLCKERKLEGAEKVGRNWLIPVETAQSYTKGTAGRPRKEGG